ncbi:hypothetical protein DFH06DRAFT_1173057 [Mycena polygramma]|nr:hypothetical protein DFH06DRAFT_1173057 [Mycena polygramma]
MHSLFLGVGLCRPHAALLLFFLTTSALPAAREVPLSRISFVPRWGICNGRTVSPVRSIDYSWQPNPGGLRMLANVPALD